MVRRPTQDKLSLLRPSALSLLMQLQLLPSGPTPSMLLPQTDNVSSQTLLQFDEWQACARDRCQPAWSTTDQAAPETLRAHTLLKLHAYL